MISAWVVAIATFGTGPQIGLAQVQSALGTMHRLAGSFPGIKSGATVTERAEYPPRKAEIEALMIYLSKVVEVMAIGKWDEQYQQNLLTVIQQTLTTAEHFDLLPEEALCWQRAGLNLTRAVERVVAQKVHSGAASPQSLVQAKAGVERFRRSYRQALARCIESID